MRTHVFLSFTLLTVASAFQLGNHVGNHAILTFPKGTSSQNGVWTQVAGTDAFKQIICVR